MRKGGARGRPISPEPKGFARSSGDLRRAIEVAWRHLGSERRERVYAERLGLYRGVAVEEGLGLRSGEAHRTVGESSVLLQVSWREEEEDPTGGAHLSVEEERKPDTLSG
jgi:hypothetical protein